MRSLPFAITSFATRQEHDIDVFTGYIRIPFARCDLQVPGGSPKAFGA
jgi:hypothetical protein